MGFDLSFQELRDLADVLTPYAIAFRYPGDVLEPAPGDADDAYRMAASVVEFVRERMPGEVVDDV